ncbi:MAG: XdhC/CoxI family protein [Verrucomicrobiota bacterium]|nr:XdhC/CoxI family protein [Verrucomicrobiota bacterium]
MTDSLLQELLHARQNRLACVLATIAATIGSVPREAGAKMLVYRDGTTSGTIGGGKFESLVVQDCLATLREGKPLLKTYPLHEASDCSFGAICGGEATVLMEPQNLNSAICLVGGGHCARAIAQLATDCGMHVTVVADRAELLAGFPSTALAITETSAPAFIAAHDWQPGDALLLVSRNHELDLEALAAAVALDRISYIGMIGSRRKVRHVFDALRERGIGDEQLSRVYAPLGLDVGADSPAEIAVSAIAELLKVQRGRSGDHLRDSPNE